MGIYIEHYLETASLMTVVGVFFVILFSSMHRRQHVDLAPLLLRATASGGIPVSLALLDCAFDPPLLLRLGGIRLYIAIAGLSVFVISLVGAGFIKSATAESARPLQVK